MNKKCYFFFNLIAVSNHIMYCAFSFHASSIHSFISPKHTTDSNLGILCLIPTKYHNSRCTLMIFISKGQLLFLGWIILLENIAVAKTLCYTSSHELNLPCIKHLYVCIFLGLMKKLKSSLKRLKRRSSKHNHSVSGY